MRKKSATVYFVLGEESGDALGVDLFNALQHNAKNKNLDVQVVGLAGERLTKAGVNSLFDINDISVMGISAVLARLPKIVMRVQQTIADIVKKSPDIVVLIDSPDFTHAVAKRVRRKLPNVPIIGYVCPSVWAWRPGRAVKMKAYVDHMLTILPFEPDALTRLQGPPATYVGHPASQRIRALRSKPGTLPAQEPPTLLILPGSRSSEVEKMLPLYGQTLDVLRQRGVKFTAVLPAVARLREKIEGETANWSVRPTIVDAALNDQTFANSHAALATSGTVSLELALHRVPTVAAYRLDRIARMFSHLVTVWTSILPNLIADRIVVPEEHNETVIPERLARRLERLLTNTVERKAQMAGFEEVIELMKTKRRPGELAAEVIFNHIDFKK